MIYKLGGGSAPFQLPRESVSSSRATVLFRSLPFSFPLVNEAVHCFSLQHELGMSTYSCMVTKDGVSSLAQQQDFINGDFRNQSI